MKADSLEKLEQFEDYQRDEDQPITYVISQLQYICIHWHGTKVGLQLGYFRKQTDLPVDNLATSANHERCIQIYQHFLCISRELVTKYALKNDV